MRAWLVLLGVVCGCHGGSQPSAAAGESRRPALVAEPTDTGTGTGTGVQAPVIPAVERVAGQPPLAAKKSWSPWRVVGEPSGEVATMGSHVEGLGQWLVTPAHPSGALQLDLKGGARVGLGPDTVLWAFERAPDALLLVRGRVTVQRLPDAPRVGERAQRIVTAHATVTLPAAAELAVGARADKASAVAVGVIVLRGSIELLRSGVAPQLVLAEQSQWPAVAGLTLHGAKTTADAQRLLDDALRPARARAALALADEQLDAALQALRELRGEGDRLLAAVSPAHAAAAPTAAAAPKSEAEIRAYQHSLTDHARRAHAAREALQLAAEQSLLKHALACGTPRPDAPPCDALGAWRARFDAALDASR